MAVNSEGKYTKLTDDTIKKLEEAFSMDCTIVEACLFANIRTQTYYNWIKENKDLQERFDELRNKPFLKARKTVMKGIEENYQNAMDYLKRKKRKEFGDNVDLTSDNKPLPIINVSGDNSNNKDKEPQPEN